MDNLLSDLRRPQALDGDASTASGEFVLREIKPSKLDKLASNEHERIRDVSKVQPQTENLPRTLDELLVFLRNAPDVDSLRQTLQAVHECPSCEPLNLGVPGPKQAQIIKCLVSTTIPDLWAVLSDLDRGALASALRNITGVNALLANIRQTLSAARAGNLKEPQVNGLSEQCAVLDTVVPVDGSTLLYGLWTKLQALVPHAVKHDLAWREAVTIFASGNIVSVLAEAEDVLKKHDRRLKYALSSGTVYAAWLAGQMAGMITSSRDDANPGLIVAAAQVCGKAMSLGYGHEIMNEVLVKLCISSEDITLLPEFLAQLPKASKDRCIDAVLAALSHNLQHHAPETAVPAVAGLFTSICQLDKTIQRHFVDILESARLSATLNLIIRRALIAALVQLDILNFAQILTRLIAVFGDKLFIDHAPLLQQESQAQCILICAGYLHRRRPESLLKIARTSSYLQSVSNRLGCSSDRAGWLGRIVGTAISRLVNSRTPLSFGMSDMETPDAAMHFELTSIDYQVGDVKQLMLLQNGKVTTKRHTVKQPIMPVINGKPTFGPIRPPQEIGGPRVTEAADSDDEDASLKPYAKPDSDPEDSDEDATLVDRTKYRGPYYIRDLMHMLRDTENAKRFQLGISKAEGLIRRKTGHGREVTDHAEELARIIANLQDPFDTENFDVLRLRALVALIVGNVTTIAPWMARQAFTRDYSIAQRSLLLTALGLSGRELAGLKNDEQLIPGANDVDFPSKKLPPHLHAMYNSQSGREQDMLDSTTRAVEDALIRPLALAAADQTTSHLNAVKIRTFSNRPKPGRSTAKPISDNLARNFERSFFNPLVSSFQMEVSAYRDSGIYLATPMLLATYLKTLAILLHATGPATHNLTQATSDLWDLLFALRMKAIEASNVMEAVLFCLLTLLDVNTNRQRLANEHPKQLMETKEWVEMIFDRTGGGSLIQEGPDEESRLRTLCAGILTKISEVIQDYQSLLMGRWTDV